MKEWEIPPSTLKNSNITYWDSHEVQCSLNFATPQPVEEEIPSLEIEGEIRHLNIRSSTLKLPPPTKTEELIEGIYKEENMPSVNVYVTPMELSFKNTIGLKNVLSLLREKQWEQALEKACKYQKKNFYEPIWQLALGIYREFIDQIETKSSRDKIGKTANFFITVFISMSEENIYFVEANKILRANFDKYRDYASDNQFALYKQRTIKNLEALPNDKLCTLVKKIYQLSLDFSDDKKFFKEHLAYCSSYAMVKRNKAKLLQTNNKFSYIITLAYEEIKKGCLRVAEIIVSEVTPNNPSYEFIHTALWSLFLKTKGLSKDQTSSETKVKLSEIFIEIMERSDEAQLQYNELVAVQNPQPIKLSSTPLVMPLHQQGRATHNKI